MQTHSWQSWPSTIITILKFQSWQAIFLVNAKQSKQNSMSMSKVICCKLVIWAILYFVLNNPLRKINDHQSISSIWDYIELSCVGYSFARKTSKWLTVIYVFIFSHINSKHSATLLNIWFEEEEIWNNGPSYLLGIQLFIQIAKLQ